MAETDFDRLTRVMLGEFSRVHERLDEHDERFDAIDRRFERVEGHLVEHDGRFDRIDENLRDITAELKQLRADDLQQIVGADGNVH
jgi:tetrahydromethanopterin S-methyltransferase subunit G